MPDRTADPGTGVDPQSLPYVHRVSKYDPADRDEHGRYIGPEDVHSDHGPVEAAYLAAVAAFAGDTGVTRLQIRDPEVAGRITFGVEAPIVGHGLAGLFPPDLTGYHDGAWIPLSTGLELVRVMLRDNGAWCRLEDENRFFVHVGYDQYVYVGSALPCRRAVALTQQRGLFAERITQSPYDPRLDEEELSQRRAADSTFWADVAALAAEHGTLILQEGYVHNASRWHRVTVDTLDAVRARLTPRAMVLLWPDQLTDVGTVLAHPPVEDINTIVWQDADGRLSDHTIVEAGRAELRALLADAHTAMILPEGEQLLHTAALPDPDGVLRARWAF